MLLDLEGKLKIDIVNPPLEYSNYLEKELHFLKPRSVLEGEEAVRIIFKDNVKIDQETFVDVGAPVGYDKEGVFFFDPNHEIARIDFHDFEKGTTLLKVSSRFNSHFFYIIVLYLMSFKMMKHDGVFCHASAVHYRGKTILFPAWRHVGKTNLMLALLQDGAEIISDDGVILFGNGEILPFSKRIHLLYYNFMEYPHLLNEAEGKIKDLVQFIDNTRLGTYEFSKSTTETFQKLIRVRLPISDVANQDHHAKRYSCDLVVHLNKQISSKTESGVIRQIATDCLATKTTESTLFELSHFISAFNTFSLVRSELTPFIDTAPERVFVTLNKGFSAVGDLFELTFNTQLNVSESKRLIDELVDSL